MSQEWKLKLFHSAQTLNVALNMLALVVIALPTGVAQSTVLMLVGVIVGLDLVAEAVKLIVAKPNVDPKKAKWEGALRAVSVTLNMLALALIFLPLGIEASNALRIVGAIILIDTVVEAIEWVLMK